MIIYSNAEIIDNPEQILDSMRLINTDQKLSESLNAGMSEQLRKSIAKRVVIRFTAFHKISWDHGNLVDVY